MSYMDDWRWMERQTPPPAGERVFPTPRRRGLIADPPVPPENPYLPNAEDFAKAMKEFAIAQGDALDEGRKFDAGKPCPDLIPGRAELEVSKVLGFGAKKYDPENWRKVSRAKQRYHGAARRHLIAYRLGETADPESGCHPLAHAICSLMFVLELELEDAEKAKTGAKEKP